jgi:hypothetical protein
MVTSVDRIQTGVRLERRLLKVLKGLAEYLDMSLGDLLEGIVLHAFERKHPFGDETVAVIGQLSEVYGLDLTAADSHRLPDSASDCDPGSDSDCDPGSVPRKEASA